MSPEPALTEPEHLFRDLLDAFPAAVYTTDADGYVTFYNREAERLAGRTPVLGKDKWCVAWKLYDASGAPLALEDCPMAVTLRKGVAVRDVEVIAERPDGVRVPLAPFPTPLRDASGRLVGAVNMLVDVSALKGAEAALAQRADEQAALFHFTDRLHRAGSLVEVYEAALDAIFMALRCHRASVLLFDDAGVMQFVGARGLSASYREAVTGHTPWTVGQTDATPILIEDVAASDLPDALKAVIATEGIQALSFVPLVADGGVIGKFMTYYDRPNAFSREHVDLALTIARQIGFSVARARADASLRASEERYRAVIEGQTDMLVRFRRDGAILFCNGVYAANRDSTPEALLGASVWDLTSGASLAPVRDQLNALNPASPAVRIEHVLKTPNGDRWTLWTVRALAFDADGAWSEAQSSGVDITDRKQADRAMFQLSAIVESSEDAIISKDLNGVIVSWNKGAEQLFGYSPAEAIGQPVTMLMAPETRNEEPGILERIRSGKRIEHYETVRFHKDGSPIHISLTVSPVRDAQGQIIGASKIARDVSERKRADEQRTLLINELNHRVKNTLATVQSLAMQTLRNTEHSAQARALLDARLAALSRAHDLLTSQNWEGAGLREIVQRALQPFRTSAQRVSVAGADVLLSPKQAVALSIALHELATNAAKYGAMSGQRGHVAVRWAVHTQAGAPNLELTWTESGGPPVEAPTRTGFGSRLIERSLAHDLGGPASIRYPREGVIAEISTPLEPTYAGALRDIK